jgi:hypothetical protein
VLRGDGHGAFRPLDLAATGLVLDGQVRHIRALQQASTAGGCRLLVVARNDQPVQVLRVSTPAPPPVARKGP